MSSDIPFLNREAELQALKDLWSEGKAQLVVVYGRRRVGKTELLSRFCHGKRAHYFVATQTRDAENLRAFARVLRENMRHPILAEGVRPTWEAVFEALAEEARTHPVIVVLDEFQYLCRDRKELPSIVQKFWDATARRSKLFLALCGSQISFMEQQVLAERAPLFGRRTAQFLVRPFSYREAALFHPRGAPEEKAALYSVFGGLPAYLSRWEPSRTLRENALSSILQPRSPLYDEVTFLLRTELGEPQTYSAILSALASGHRRLGEIAGFVGIPSVSAIRYLETLRGLRLAERMVPLGEAHPGRSRKGRYQISDPFMRFWYRFVLPNQSLLEVGQAERVYDALIAPQMAAYLGTAFEAICMQFLQRAPAGEWTPCTRIGKHWDRDVEVDLATENIDGSHYVCECKWTSRPVGMGVLDRLQESRDKLPERLQRECRLVLFSRRGFTASLKARANFEGVRLVSLSELYKV